jgi:hypothetical protein
MFPEGSLASGIINVTIVDSIPVLRPVDRFFFDKEAIEFNRLVKLLRKKRYFDLVVDLSGCQEISSEGLGMIASCWDRYQKKAAGYMGVVLPRATENSVVTLFDVTGLSRSIGCALQRRVADAVSYLKSFSPKNK